MNIFKEGYYWLVKILMTIKTNDTPRFNAFIGISFFQGINVLSLIGILNSFLKLNISRNIAVFTGLFVWIGVSLFNFVYLFLNSESIIEAFDSKPKRTTGKALLIIYMIATLIIFFYVINYLVIPKYE
jgi:Kef-type K+ transport system membrane component KefB